jgi:glutaredoxin
MSEFRCNVVDDCPYCHTTLTLDTQHTHRCAESDNAEREQIEKTIREMTNRPTTPVATDPADEEDQHEAGVEAWKTSGPISDQNADDREPLTSEGPDLNDPNTGEV